jgi:hypothetical protein
MIHFSNIVLALDVVRKREKPAYQQVSFNVTPKSI